MNKSNVLPEDTALAEEIAAIPYMGEVARIAALIAAHRPPLVARLVAELERLIKLCREHGFGANSPDVEDAVRQILQAAIMEAGNVKTMRVQLAARVDENARLVSDLARLRAALEPFAAAACDCPDCKRARAALSPAPVLDLAEIERKLGRAQKALRNSREANHPTAVTVEMMALGEIDAVLASLREVTHVR